jgi:hypothetical protein
MRNKLDRNALATAAITAVCDVMRSYGVRRQVAEKQLEIAIEKVYSRRISARPSEPRPITQVADVCSRWFLEERFVDKQGSPKPLTWTDGRGSLLTLVEHVHGKKNAKAIADQLLRRRLVRRTANGKWLPKAQIVPPTGVDRAQILRTETMVARLVRTIIHNTEKKYRGPDLFFEVMAQVRKLPSRDLNAFRRYAKVQGLLFARAVDLWLESRDVRHRSRAAGSTREVGVVAFAFAEKPRKF